MQRVKMQLYMFVDMHLTIFDMQKILCSAPSKSFISLIHSDYQYNCIWYLYLVISQPLISMKYLISPFKDVRWLDGHVCNDELLYFVNILFTLSRLLMFCISNYDGSRNSAQYNKLIYFGSDTLLPLVHNDGDDEKCIFYVLRNIVKRL